MASSDPKRFFAGRLDAVIACLLALGTLILLLATINDYGMTWDEGFTVEREERLLEWFARVGGDSSEEARVFAPRLSKLDKRLPYLREAGRAASSPWSRESLRFYWQFAREEPNGHPPFYALLGLGGWGLSHRFIPPPGSYRFGPIVLFAITLGVLYRFMARRYSRTAALISALTFLTMPRVFAHAHLASYDMPTLCLWFLATVAFLRVVAPPPEVESATSHTWFFTATFGLMWGLAEATKFTGWFLPFPLVAWIILYREWKAARVLLAGAVIAAATVYCLIPTWWAQPVAGLREFLESNLTRHELLPIPTTFLNQLYWFSLPWYNTMVWTAVVVPPLTLVLALVGIGRVLACRFRDRVGTMLLGSWAFIMILRALPNAPGHDGVRLFLVAFVFLSCLAGIGWDWACSFLNRIASPRLARPLGLILVAATIGSSAWSTWRFHPLQLSYYNAFIGGLSGAQRAGMEPTYYWDALTPDVREWLNEHTETGRSVAFVFPAVTFEYLHRWGLIRTKIAFNLNESPQWFVVMNRTGLLAYPKENLGRYLLNFAWPAYVKRLEFAPEVPLIAIYPGEEAFAANERLKESENPVP